LFTKRFRVLTTALTCVAVGLVVPTPATADPLTFYVKNRHTGLCLGVASLPIGNGTDVVQRPCGDPLSLRWRLLEDEGGNYRFVVSDLRVGTATCLDVAYASEAAGAPLQTWQCLDTSWNQAFRISWWQGWSTVKPSHTADKCLDHWSQNATSRPLVVQENCSFEPRQEFAFQTAP
jgi:hypothetical protein